jgi:hypothetical protein
MAETTIPENALHSFVDALDKANMRTAKRFPGDSPARQPVHTVYGGAHLFKADAARNSAASGRNRRRTTHRTARRWHAQSSCRLSSPIAAIYASSTS